METLDTDEIRTILHDNGVGVLALDGGPGPYAIPVAFGYEQDNQRLVLQLSEDDSSRKSRSLTHNPNVCLTVYEETEPGAKWRSVLVEGKLVEIPYAEAETAFATLAKRTAEVPTPMGWRSVTDAATVTPYELEIEDLSGQQFARG